MRRTPGLDAIRGLAILMVLVWHYMPETTPIPPLLFYSYRLFWSGVDMFFVLSGFLIASILFQNSDARNYFSVFYLRRAARILPLYLALFLFFYLILRFDLQIFYKSFKNHLPLWSYLTFTQNFFYAERGRFADPIMDITWSLAVEEQFYIFLSILIRCFSKRQIALLSFTLIVLAPALRFFSTQAAAYILPYNRVDALMWGVLLAMIWGSQNSQTIVLRNIKYLKILFFCLLLGVIYMSYWNYSFGGVLSHSWLAAFYAVIILFALGSNALEKRTIFDNRFLQWLGLRSYGIYLLHRPVMVVLSSVLVNFYHIKLNTWALTFLFTFVTFLIAEISFRFFEKPLVEFGHRFKYRFSESSPQPLRTDV